MSAGCLTRRTRTALDVLCGVCGCGGSGSSRGCVEARPAKAAERAEARSQGAGAPGAGKSKGGVSKGHEGTERRKLLIVPKWPPGEAPRCPAAAGLAGAGLAKPPGLRERASPPALAGEERTAVTLRVPPRAGEASGPSGARRTFGGVQATGRGGLCKLLREPAGLKIFPSRGGGGWRKDIGLKACEGRKSWDGRYRLES
mmetsp:Transcript_112226/g.298253  ORF Transcript_112226/g.298253 Transcript_112226/m.298253 type:complete len:200 (-) Transcript_112226:26-625(-)